MDVKAIDFLLDDLDLPFLKVPSNDTNSLAYLTHAASKGKPLIVSTGMCAMETVVAAHRTLTELKTDFALLQCTSTYPLEPRDANLSVIRTYAERFPEAVVGYSGHETGISLSIAAVALGAKVLERHVTLDKTWKGNDHAASLEPDELRAMVAGIRAVESGLGDGVKRMLKSEAVCRNKLGKSLVATRDLKAGEEIGPDSVVAKVAEPHGIRPEWLAGVVGKKLLRDLKADQTLLIDVFQGWTSPEIEEVD